MPRYRSALVTLTLLALAAFPRSAASAQRANDPETRISIDDCVDKLLQPAPASERQQYDIYLAARIIDGGCDLELTVWRKDPDGPSTARLQIADEYRILKKLSALTAEGKTLVPEDFCTPKLLEIVETTSTVEPELATLVSRLQNLAVPAVPESILIIHGLIYRITLTSGFSESTYHFYAPGRPRPPGSELHPLDSWIEDVRELLGVVSCPVPPDAGGSSAELRPLSVH